MQATYRFQAEAGKTNPVTRSAVADTPLSAHTPPLPRKKQDTRLRYPQHDSLHQPDSLRQEDFRQ